MRRSLPAAPDVDKFPIPMRGNEAGKVKATFTTDGTFPIPMRGNEYQYTEYRDQAHYGSRSP